jgi:hypothetical protein
MEVSIGESRGICSPSLVIGSVWRGYSNNAVRIQRMRNKEVRNGHLRGVGL